MMMIMMTTMMMMIMTVRRPLNRLVVTVSVIPVPRYSFYIQETRVHISDLQNSGQSSKANAYVTF